MITYFHFRGLYFESGWLTPAYVGVDQNGLIQYVSEKAPADPVPLEFVDGFALAGFQNSHSHAFQYAMAGRAEIHPAGSQDDFWSWREAMYACALSMNPNEMQSVATMLYIEMLRKGYTHVAEFHYLHHDKDGKPYSNLCEMGLRLLEAAKTAGIRITLIPVFYQKGGFGKDPQPRQYRFISKTVDDYFQLLDDTAEAVRKYSFATLGFSVHSLRAVDEKDILRTFTEGPKSIPFHIHTAEQVKEVQDCVSYLKQRPVEWMLNSLPVDERFHLVHCTHMNDAEVTRLAKSGGNAVLCPGTEGNLGDGIFRLTDYANAGGNWSIGTDSNISLNYLEDLRWLDYAQRFTTHKRNTFHNGAKMLLDKTNSSGRRAMGLTPGSHLKINSPLDVVVFSAKSPVLSHGKNDFLLPSIIYNCDSADIFGTMVNGKWIVKGQHHENSKETRKSFEQVLKTINF
jgi:formimidoylglutamate deiminase